MPKTNRDFAYEEMMASAKKLLLKKRVVTLEELEDHLFDGFHKHWSEGAYDNLEGKNSTGWKNFTMTSKPNSQSRASQIRLK